MTRKFNTWLTVGAVLVLLAGMGTARAGGFMIGEMAARSSGMGSAFTAVADDASAAWHNPAGVAFMQGVQVMAGGDGIFVPGIDYASNTFTKGAGGAPVPPTSLSSANKSLFVPHAYATWTDPDSAFGTALSINSPFGLETDWPITAPFASKATFSRIQMVMINPSIVYRLTDHLSIAAGASYANMFKVDLNTTIQDLSGNGDGWGGTAALMYRNEAFSLGVSYRSRIKVNIDGTAVGKGALAAAGTSPGVTSITLPDQVNVGLAWKPTPEWTLSADVDWVNWKTFDALDIRYASAVYRAVLSAVQTAVGATPTGALHLPENWKATVAVRLGAEWNYAPNMRARFGYVFDPTPINDTYFTPAIPGNDRHLFSLGYGYDFNERTTLDLAYVFVYFAKRDQTASPVAPIGAPESVKNGSYKAQVHIVAASLSYRF